MVTQILVTFCFGVFTGHWMTKILIREDKSEEDFVTLAAGLIVAFLIYLIIMLATPTTYINICENHKGITVDSTILDFANCNNQKEK